MKIKHLIGRIVLSGAVIAASFGIASAQQNEPVEATPNATAKKHSNQPQVNKMRLIFESLGLSPEQLRQIRDVQKADRLELRTANQNHQQSQRLLNEAIYAPTVDENLVAQRLNDAVAAQAALIRIRVANELRIRQILTPEQTLKFVEMRKKLFGKGVDNQSTPNLPRRREAFRKWQQLNNSSSPKPNEKRLVAQ